MDPDYVIAKSLVDSYQLVADSSEKRLLGRSWLILMKNNAITKAMKKGETSSVVNTYSTFFDILLDVMELSEDEDYPESEKKSKRQSLSESREKENPKIVKEKEDQKEEDEEAGESIDESRKYEHGMIPSEDIEEIALGICQLGSRTIRIGYNREDEDERTDVLIDEDDECPFGVCKRD